MTPGDEGGQRPLSAIYEEQAKNWTARRRSELAAEIARLEGELRGAPDRADLYSSIAERYTQSGDSERAAASLREGIAACPPAAGLYWQLTRALRESGRTQQSIAVAGQAVRRAPEGRQFRLAQLLTLPVIYDTAEEMAVWRRRFARRLEALEREVLASDSPALRTYIEGLRRFTNFYLPYQGNNDRTLQQQYGRLVQHVMQANYPQWSSRVLDMPELAPGGRLKVGYASSHFYDHTVARLFGGWLGKCDRNRFHVHTYYSGQVEDPVSRRIRDSSESYVHIPQDFEAMCRQIWKDRLHVLIFPDIGMTPETTMLAALRLAPVQCMSWGHPVTSGVPTVDYFLSSELMEPPGAQQHYSEQLVLLPGIGVSVEKPPIPRAILNKPRSAWGIPGGAVVYLCCQSLFKYQPRYDHLFAAIASRVAGATFVFLAEYPYLGELFDARLQRAFSAKGLRSEDYCLILPTQHRLDYWNLNLVSDVFLDSVGWSGGMSALDAIACGLPIVTLPGKFMRGRHSYAILKQLEMTDTIASSEDEYIHIAARLGLDAAWRKSVVRRIAGNAAKLYDDRRSALALEEFLLKAVSSRCQGSRRTEPST